MGKLKDNFLLPSRFFCVTLIGREIFNMKIVSVVQRDRAHAAYAVDI